MHFGASRVAQYTSLAILIRQAKSSKRVQERCGNPVKAVQFSGLALPDSFTRLSSLSGVKVIRKGYLRRWIAHPVIDHVNLGPAIHPQNARSGDK